MYSFPFSLRRFQPPSSNSESYRLASTGVSVPFLLISSTSIEAIRNSPNTANGRETWLEEKGE
ncbi:hypothetical protein KP509_32G040900 [Ceratopteris richardii]|uniref:Uncharacterized protein n=1 Tax=Ceratopteris richardii TaxID=49495 RepID=A0A8T2QU95_CERRI|nr:hypothetical protein KP509_32G040900 [Ceratopteris richardii]